MKYIEKTASALVIKNKLNISQSISAFVIATFLIGLPLMVMLWVVYHIGVTTFKCKRIEANQVNCEKQESKFAGLVEQPPIKFIQVKSAEFKTREEIDSEGDRLIENWVTLATSSGEVTAVKDFASIDGATASASQMQQIANQFNNFIKSNQPYLVIERDLGEDLYNILLALGFAMIIPEIIGVSLLFSHFRYQTLTFDKKSGQLILEQKTLFSQKYEYYPLHKIQEVDIQEKYYGRQGRFYELRLIPKDILKPIPKNIHKAIRLSDKKLLYIKNIKATISEFLTIELPKTFPYFFLRALFLNNLITEENGITLLFSVVYAVSIERLP
ncbi:MAG: hypothetical protein AAF063_13405 [Cyanobacteria bacterium J06643_5]